MSNHELTPVSYLVLGLIACGAATSYELKQKVAGSVGYMWAFPHSALYAEPPRLTQLGLLDEQREETGRRRRLYTITDTGRAALQNWLHEPTSEPPQLRDLGLLKLFFSSLATPDQVRALAQTQQAAHQQRLTTYETIQAEIPDQPSDPFPAATLRMGLMVERAFIAFWTSIAQQPPTPPTQTTATTPSRRPTRPTP